MKKFIKYLFFGGTVNPKAPFFERYKLWQYRGKNSH
jgi:hypothetical protein